MPDLGQSVARPTKAYYVEKIARTTTTLLVYADNVIAAREAARRGAFYEAIDSETEGRGLGRVWRAPEADRDA